MAQISARRATAQEKKATRQFVVAMLVAAAIGLFFIFVLLPVVFSLVVGSARRGGGIFDQAQDVIPPQRPVIQPPPSHQNTTSLAINGYSSPEVEVRLFVDFSEQGVTTTDLEGAFSFDIQLSEGEHEFWIIATNESGATSQSQNYSVVVDLTAPTLTVSEPEDGAVFTLPRERVLTVAGRASEQAQVQVNGSVVHTDSDGNFSTTIQLSEGENQITLVATDQAGNSSEETVITVEYRP